MADKDATPAAGASAPADTSAGLKAVINSSPGKSADDTPGHDIEKQVPAGATQTTAVDDDVNQKPERDDSSDFKQDGVARVQAVTSVWTSKTMWSMFAM